MATPQKASITYIMKWKPNSLFYTTRFFSVFLLSTTVTLLSKLCFTNCIFSCLRSTKSALDSKVAIFLKKENIVVHAECIAVHFACCYILHMLNENMKGSWNLQFVDVERARYIKQNETEGGEEAWKWKWYKTPSHVLKKWRRVIRK